MGESVVGGCIRRAMPVAPIRKFVRRLFTPLDVAHYNACCAHFTRIWENELTRLKRVRDVYQQKGDVFAAVLICMIACVVLTMPLHVIYTSMWQWHVLCIFHAMVMTGGIFVAMYLNEMYDRVGRVTHEIHLYQRRIVNTQTHFRRLIDTQTLEPTINPTFNLMLHCAWIVSLDNK